MINPPEGTLLAGYLAKRPAEGVHDPLFAKVLALKIQNKTLLMISLDLVSVDSRYVSELRNEIHDTFQIPIESIMVHSTHTHSGPGGMTDENSIVYKAFSGIWPPYVESIVKDHYEKIKNAVHEALSSLTPCTVRYGKGKALGIAANRISIDRHFEPDLNVIIFERITGKQIIVYHFACHPTIMHADNLLVSADFPGAANKYLEQNEEVEMSLFLNGPSGDVSTRFTRKDSSFDEVERMGRKLSECVLSTIKASTKLSVNHLDSNIVPITLGPRRFETEDQLRGSLLKVQEEYKHGKEKGLTASELRRIESKIEGLTASINLVNKLQNVAQIKSEIQIVSIGDMYLATVPGEMFYETGWEITNEFDEVCEVLLLGNTNDYIGYIVPEKFYEDNSYESSMTLLEKGSTEYIASQIIKNVGGMKHVSNQRL